MSFTFDFLILKIYPCLKNILMIPNFKLSMNLKLFNSLCNAFQWHPSVSNEIKVETNVI